MKPWDWCLLLSGGSNIDKIPMGYRRHGRFRCDAKRIYQDNSDIDIAQLGFIWGVRRRVFIAAVTPVICWLMVLLLIIHNG